ncbi:MAG TPA: hypothetical protein VGK73_09635 [Polyangiaceae bacterium]
MHIVAKIDGKLPRMIPNRKRLNAKTSIVSLLAVLAAGCGGAGDDVTTASGPDVIASPTEEMTVLHEFKVGKAHYRFFDASASGEPSVLVEQVAPLDMGTPPLTQLLEEHPGLTNLEIYLTLAPEGEPPAEVLVASHALEAKNLGRADAAMRPVEFQPTLLVEKSRTTCGTQATNLLRAIWGGSIKTEAYSAVEADMGFPGFYFVNVSTGNRTTAISLVLCNETPYPIWGQFFSTYGLIHNGETPAGHTRGYHMGVTSTAKQMWNWADMQGYSNFHAARAWGVTGSIPIFP